MSYASTLNALEARLRDRWTETAIVGEGDTFERPNPPAAFVTFEFGDGAGRIAGFGNGVTTRTEGTLVLSVFAPVGAAGLIREAVERLAALFPTGGGIGDARFLGAPRFGRVLPADGDGGWIVGDVEIPFSVDCLETV
ncbi:hypothetical protein AZL_022020 [Azospirillum sp. B510]|uniref:hypothetical protein n=1 Tax=Azospirillum sp. (strain B510) TaxID=137722 RepID=UPI0001C4BEF7|nr:hypothetical protein [Azospirillum sp. B510]BAI72840.1 hypothetical protein AZL_022020 [Azospirillum sp. B510]